MPIISEIVRIPQERPEPLSKKHRRRGTTKPPSSRNNSKQQEVYVDNPEDGWDAETDQNAMVIDYDTKQEIEKGTPQRFTKDRVGILISSCFVFIAIAQTAAMLNPKQPLNASYAFQKVFSDGEFVAGGVLEIPVGGKKPSKPARDNTYVRGFLSSAANTKSNKIPCSSFTVSKVQSALWFTEVHSLLLEMGCSWFLEVSAVVSTLLLVSANLFLRHSRESILSREHQ